MSLSSVSDSTRILEVNFPPLINLGVNMRIDSDVIVFNDIPFDSVLINHIAKCKYAFALPSCSC